MTEHETTIEVLRKELLAKLHTWQLEPENFAVQIKRFGSTIEDYKQYQNFGEACTTLQLHALCKLIDRGTKLELLRCNPDDHVAVTFANMYVGIERDGYTHS